MNQQIQGTIGFADHKINCIIGMLPEERTKDQEIAVDLKVKTPFKNCISTDELKDTIDYVALANLCTEIAQQGKYKLIESFAYAVIQKIIAEFDVAWAWVKVRKKSALPSASFATVELEGWNEKCLDDQSFKDK
jgi:dihydroneopterin aldolase